MKKFKFKRLLGILLCMTLSLSNALYVSATGANNNGSLELSIPYDHYNESPPNARSMQIGSYYMRNKRTGLYLTVTPAGRVVMTEYTGGKGQRWDLLRWSSSGDFFILRTHLFDPDGYVEGRPIDYYCLDIAASNESAFQQNGADIKVTYVGNSSMDPPLVFENLSDRYKWCASENNGSYLVISKKSYDYNASQATPDINNYRSVTCCAGLDDIFQHFPCSELDGSSHWFFEYIPYESSTHDGWINSVNDSGVSGWAYDPQNPDREIVVKITVENTDGAVFYDRRIVACLYDEGLENAGIGNGNHAFSHSIPWYDIPPGTYTVKAYAHGRTDCELFVLEGVEPYTVTGSPPATAEEYYGSLNWRYPLRSGHSNDTRISAAHGLQPYYPSSSGHTGLDVGGGVQDEYIYCMTNGVVIAAGTNSSAGNYIVIETNNYVYGTNTKIRYAYYHMHHPTPLAVGTVVTSDTTVGYVGTTGNSTGYHLHIEINITTKPWSQGYEDTINPVWLFPDIAFTGAV